MSSYILFVFEGEDTESKIVGNLQQNFIEHNAIIECAFCADIYQLHREISNDEDLDTFVLLKKRPQNSIRLSNFKRENFAEIYLFFDYDGHATLADDNKIIELLNFFNEETSKGKLFLSYPMVEALKHYSNELNFKELRVNAKENIKYKEIVNKECSNYLQNLTAYSKEIWVQLIEVHLKKMNYISHDEYSLPKAIISQNFIFKKQLEKYIRIESKIAVLSSFPVFLFDYYGTQFIANLTIDNKQ